MAIQCLLNSVFGARQPDGGTGGENLSQKYHGSGQSRLHPAFQLRLSQFGCVMFPDRSSAC